MVEFFSVGVFVGKYADIKGMTGGTFVDEGLVGTLCLFRACNAGLGGFDFWVGLVKYFGSIKGLFSFPVFKGADRTCGDVFDLSSGILPVFGSALWPGRYTTYCSTLKTI